MREISLDELFKQYVDAVEIVAADAATQRAWMDLHDFPADEIWQNLDQSVFSFTARLTRAGRLTEAAVSAVAAILTEFESWDNPSLWRSDDALGERAEWAQARETAQQALAVLKQAPG